MKIDSYLISRSVLTFMVITVVSGCTTSYSNNNQNLPANTSVSVTDQYKENLNAIQEIHDKYSCDIDEESGAYYLMKSYIRMSTSTLEFSNASAIRELELYRKIASTYVAPSYFQKYYLLPNTSIVTDSYAKSRAPELVCIKLNNNTELEAYVFSYHQARAAYAHVDKYNIVKENNRYYIYPNEKPYDLLSSVEQMYKNIGVLNIPKSEIKIKKTIYKQ